jgi:hypothetical protein
MKAPRSIPYDVYKFLESKPFLFTVIREVVEKRISFVNISVSKTVSLVMAPQG